MAPTIYCAEMMKKDEEPSDSQTPSGIEWHSLKRALDEYDDNDKDDEDEKVYYTSLSSRLIIIYVYSLTVLQLNTRSQGYCGGYCSLTYRNCLTSFWLSYFPLLVEWYFRHTHYSLGNCLK